MIEEVVDAVFEGVDVEHPAPPRNLNAELVLFVALGGKGVKVFSPPPRLLA